MTICIDWEKTPLVPAIAQEADSGEVLMQAFMNEEAFNLTLKTGFVHYYSRSKKRIWKKGEESGSLQIVKDVRIDCDGDSVLVLIEQAGGAACHTGRKSCFYTSVMQDKEVGEQVFDPSEKYGTIDTLYHTILERKNASSEESYTAKLLQKGENTILKKCIEEAGEFCFAVKDSNEEAIVYEAADVLFHGLVALGYKNISPDLIDQELRRRFGLSGLEEKKNRSE